MKNVNRLVFILSLAGLLVSGYLLERYVTGGHVACGGEGGCDIVRQSSYSSFLGIPIPAYGLVFYFIIFVLSFAITVKPIKLLNLLLFISSAVGLLVSLILFYIEVVVIHALCWWCTASGIISLLLFILCLRFLNLSGKPSNP